MNMSLTIRAGAWLPSSVAAAHAIAGRLKPVGHQVAQDRIVIDDEDVSGAL
jgi:hypothetical protein